MTTLYNALVDAGIRIENHESDMYFKVTDTARRILWRFPGERVSLFVSPLDGQTWYEVPFAYEPFWDRKKAEARGR